MHAPFDRSGKTPFDRSEKRDQGSFLKNTVALLALPVLITIALVALTLVHPKSSMWISQSVQAEFGGNGVADDMPADVAQPAAAPPSKAGGWMFNPTPTTYRNQR